MAAQPWTQARHPAVEAWPAVEPEPPHAATLMTAVLREANKQATGSPPPPVSAAQAARPSPMAFLSHCNDPLASWRRTVDRSSPSGLDHGERVTQAMVARLSSDAVKAAWAQLKLASGRVGSSKEKTGLKGQAPGLKAVKAAAVELCRRDAPRRDAASLTALLLACQMLGLGLSLHLVGGGGGADASIMRVAEDTRVARLVHDGARWVTEQSGCDVRSPTEAAAAAAELLNDAQPTFFRSE